MTDGPVLVLGSTGLLGTAVVAELRSRGLPLDAPSSDELDIRSAADVEARFVRHPPSAVINAAAFTDVQAAERPASRELVLAVNRDGPQHLARACARRAIPLVHVSTDFVFDGESDRPYREDDLPAPLQVYGRSKWEGEEAVLRSYPGAIVVRTSTLFGPGRRDRPHYIDAILSQARDRDRITVVATPIASPTYSADLAQALFALLDARAVGIVHVANRGGCSRIELAREAIRALGPRSRAEIEERPEDPRPPRRPRYCVLDTRRFEACTGRPMRGWGEAVAHYVEYDSR